MAPHTAPTTIDWSDHDQIAADIDWPFEKWAHQCHAVSIAIVKHYGIGRVARGSARGVMGQHSWITLGDPYDPDATIVDPTLWSYDDTVTGIIVTTIDAGRHHPHGWADGLNIMAWGCPEAGGEPEIKLTPTTPLSGHAVAFLDMCRSAAGPLDRRFYMSLASHAPVGGWPAAEIITALCETPELAFVVPVDIEGMLTDRNPGGLYLPGGESD